MRVSPRRATVRLVSDVISSVRREAGSTRASALLMIFDVMMTISPSRSGPSRSASIAARITCCKISSGLDLPDSSGRKDRDRRRLIS
jgi:hypothetical protein